MAYTAQTWTNGVGKLNATRMTVIETGIADIHNLVDAKGDLYTATAADTPSRLAVGANNTLLVADSAQATGLKWSNITDSMVDAAAAIAISKLAGYPTDAAKYLRGDGTWAGAFSTYTPVWGSTGVAPSLGNGSIPGRYLQVGKLVYLTINLVAGTTTTFGTGQWTFSLPVTQAASRIPIANVLYFDASAGQFFPGKTWDASSTTVALYNTVSPMTAVTATVPFAWATSDQVILTLVYEAV